MSFRRKSTRREFLRGEAALDALQHLQGPGDSPSQPQPASALPAGRKDCLLQIGRRAMACDFEVCCQPARFPGAVEASTEALDLIEMLEDQMTVYRDHSEIMRVNRDAHRLACRVEARLFALLHQCLQWSAETEGAFDITTGPLIKLWGFYTRQGRFPAEQEVQEVLQRVGYRHVRLDQEQLAVRFDCPGVELNLGSVGKGYALDRAAEILDAAGVADYLFHGGKSSILARGARQAATETAAAVPWSIALQHPLRPERRLAELTVRDRAVGTSGSGRQFFYHGGRRYGHVLDPRTGRPAEGLLSATVLAPRAAQADALATTFFVLGIDATRAYCESHPELAVVFVLPGTRGGTVAVESVGIVDELLWLESS
jgi:thiamine biosynthesis lipoprotein